MSSAKGFPAVPFFDHPLRCYPGYIRCIRHYLALHDWFTVLFVGHVSLSNTHDDLVPAADIVCHIVVITGPFSYPEPESTSRSTCWSPVVSVVSLRGALRVSATLLRVASLHFVFKS